MQRSVLRHADPREPVVVLDVGVHQGERSGHLIRQAKEQRGRLDLHAFEPTASSFAELERRLHDSRALVTLNRSCVSDTAGAALDHRPQEGAGSVSPYDRDWLDDRAATSERIMLTAIDPYCEKHGIPRIDLLKREAVAPRGLPTGQGDPTRESRATPPARRAGDLPGGEPPRRRRRRAGVVHLVFTAPAEAAVTDTGTHRARLYGRYVTAHLSGGSGHRVPHAVLMRQVMPGLPPARSARILDMGCGSGDLIEALRGLGYRSLHGVDISAEQVDRARQRGIAEVTRGDIHDHLREAAGRYDAIVALDVLEHFRPDELLPLLELVAAAMRPEGPGVFVARVPNATSPFGGRYRYGDLTHDTSFTTRSLHQLLSETGFRGLRFRPVEPVPRGAKSALRLVLWRAAAALMKLVLAAETGEFRGHVVTQNVLVYAHR